MPKPAAAPPPPPVRSPRASTRSFLHLNTSMLRKPSKNEEFAGFWVKVWPEMIKSGWRYETLHNNYRTNNNSIKDDEEKPPAAQDPPINNFVFHNTSSGESFNGIPAVLQVAERMPSLGYFLIQMVQYDTTEVATDDDDDEDEKVEPNNSNNDQIDIIDSSTSPARKVIKQRNSSSSSPTLINNNVSAREQEPPSKPSSPCPTIDLPLINTIDASQWPGMRVRISTGVYCGHTARIIKRSGKGWVALRSYNGLVCRRAHELQVLPEGECDKKQYGLVDEPVESEWAEVEVEQHQQSKKKVTAVTTGLNTSNGDDDAAAGSRSNSTSPVPDISRSRRAVKEPERYEDTALLQKKRRPSPDNPDTHVSQNGNHSDSSDTKNNIILEKKMSLSKLVANDPSNDLPSPDKSGISDQQESDIKLLSTIDASYWLGQRVKVLAGPAEGKRGTTMSINHGWIHVKIDNYKGDETYCRRAFELEVLVSPALTSALESMERMSQRKRKRRSDAGVSRAALRGSLLSLSNASVQPPQVPSQPSDFSSESFKLTGRCLTTLDLNKWPGTLVQIRAGPQNGSCVRVIRSCNGWVHLCTDITKDVSQMTTGSYDVCRRAFELEIVTELKPPTASVSLETPGTKPGVSFSKNLLSPFPMQIYNPTPSPQRHHNVITLGISPGSTNDDNPYKNKKIMIGSNYQVSNSNIPTKAETDDVKSQRMEMILSANISIEENQCIWSRKDTDEEMYKFLNEFPIGDHDLVMELLTKSKNVDDPFTFVKSQILEQRVGSLKVIVSPERSSVEESTNVAEHRKPLKKRRYMLAANSKFHKKAIKAKQLLEKLGNMDLHQTVEYGRRHYRPLSVEKLVPDVVVDHDNNLKDNDDESSPEEESISPTDANISSTAAADHAINSTTS